jgi:hypothetical protein
LPGAANRALHRSVDLENALRLDVANDLHPRGDDRRSTAFRRGRGRSVEPDWWPFGGVWWLLEDRHVGLSRRVGRCGSGFSRHLSMTV